MPRVVTTQRTLYKFNELPANIQEKAVDKLSDINVDDEWWDYIYEDAERAGLKITGFEINRGRGATGKFLIEASEVAHKVIAEHGAECETFATATDYLASILEFDKDSDEYQARREDLDEVFLKSLLADYSTMLQKEWDYKVSSEAIRETIEANEYEFDEHGNLA